MALDHLYMYIIHIPKPTTPISSPPKDKCPDIIMANEPGTHHTMDLHLRPIYER